MDRGQVEKMSENRKEILTAEGFLREGQKNEKQESGGGTVSETDIKSMTLPELEAYLKEMGENPFRAKQLYQWMHVKLAASFDDDEPLQRHEGEAWQAVLLCLPDTGGCANLSRGRNQKIPV